jgi:membrane protein implicated in regulation of membrane protease activity
MWYRAGADLVVVVHLLFIGFIVGGVFLTWRWPLIIWAHIPAVIYGALVEFAGFTCPLTLLENDLRERAGEAGYRDGFVAHYLVKVIYPPGLTHGMQIGLGVLLLLVAIIGYWRFLRRRGRGVARALADEGPAGTRGRASAPAGGAAVASCTRRGFRAPPKVTQHVGRAR